MITKQLKIDDPRAPIYKLSRMELWKICRANGIKFEESSTPHPELCRMVMQAGIDVTVFLTPYHSLDAPNIPRAMPKIAEPKIDSVQIKPVEQWTIGELRKAVKKIGNLDYHDKKSDMIRKIKEHGENATQRGQ